MMRRLWLAAAVAVPALVAAIPSMFIASIWAGSWRLAETGFVLLVIAVPAVPVFWLWTEEKKPKPNLPRRERKRLRDEESRIRFEAEVRRMEREAGLS